MSKNSLSEAGSRVLATAQDYFAKHKAMPSFAELARTAGLSTSTVALHVEALKSSGHLNATSTGRLMPGKVFFQRPLGGVVRAGLPAFADEPAVDCMLIDDYLVDTPSRTFLLTVKGDSMSEAGILAGDILVVKRGALAVPGDIVVVNVAGEGTVKELAQDQSGGLFLRARNQDYPDISPAEGFEVMGVVTGQFRRMVRKAAPSATRRIAPLSRVNTTAKSV